MKLLFHPHDLRIGHDFFKAYNLDFTIKKVDKTGVNSKKIIVEKYLLGLEVSGFGLQLLKKNALVVKLLEFLLVEKP